MLSKQEEDFANISATISNECSKITKKLMEPSQPANIRLIDTQGEVSAYFDAATKDYRVRLAYCYQKEIRKFLNVFVLERLQLAANKNGGDVVELIGEVWENFQRFAYALQFINIKPDLAFKEYYKTAQKDQSIIDAEQKKDPEGAGYEGAVSTTPVMALRIFRQFLCKNRPPDAESFLLWLTSKLQVILPEYLGRQRNGERVDREKLNQSIQFYEALYYNHECDCFRVGDQLKIRKSATKIGRQNKTSEAGAKFKVQFMNQILKGCEAYYENWVINKAMPMLSVEEMKLIAEFLAREEDIAAYYLHDEANARSYLDTVQKSLVQFRFKQRIGKNSGLKSLLANYESGKPEMAADIINFWKIYKRVIKNVQNFNELITLYSVYFKEEALVVSKTYEKPPEFIQQCIKLNKKNIQIVNMLGKSHEFDRIRVNYMEEILLMKYTGDPKVKEHFGVKHWAAVFSSKLKAKYAKTEKFGESETDLLNIFKLLALKTVAVNEYSKLLCARLMEEADMSLEANFSNIIDMESKILDEIKKETSENDIKSIQACLKDMKNSFDEKSRLKKLPEMSKFNFFNQIIIKSGNHWSDTVQYDIQPPNLFRDCLEVIRKEIKNSNFIFEFQNGTTVFAGAFKKETLRFNFKNIYLMILLHIDQQANKKMYFTDLLQVLQPAGKSERTTNELIRCIIELCIFGILKTNRTFKPEDVANLWTWGPGDLLEINICFEPAKKLQCYKTANLAVLPDYIKKSLNAKLSTLDEEEKKIEKDRRFAVQGTCVQLLKHSQATQGTISFNQLFEGQKKEHRVTMAYLKEVMEGLIYGGFCERTDKKDHFKYKS